MIDSVMIKYANALEMHARKIKKSIEEKRKKIFFKKYDFIDMKGKNKKDVRNYQNFLHLFRLYSSKMEFIKVDTL